MLIENYFFNNYQFDILMDDNAFTGDEQLDVYVQKKNDKNK